MLKITTGAVINLNVIIDTIYDHCTLFNLEKNIASDKSGDKLLPAARNSVSDSLATA